MVAILCLWFELFFFICIIQIRLSTSLWGRLLRSSCLPSDSLLQEGVASRPLLWPVLWWQWLWWWLPVGTPSPPLGRILRTGHSSAATLNTNLAQILRIDFSSGLCKHFYNSICFNTIKAIFFRSIHTDLCQPCLRTRVYQHFSSLSSSKRQKFTKCTINIRELHSVRAI